MKEIKDYYELKIYPCIKYIKQSRYVSEAGT